MTKVEFSTTQYEFSHGRKPKGYGSWAFVCKDAASKDPVWAPGTMNYADAKRWMTAHVRTLAPAGYAVAHVEVCS